MNMAWFYWAQLFFLATIPTALHTLSIQPARPEATETLDIDPYTGQMIERYSINQTEKTDCHLSIFNKSARGFKNILEIYHPNFVHFTVWFNQNSTVTGRTKEAIFPFRWVWTYYSPKGFFPYLKWPVDFPILSFGLLDFKTFPGAKNKKVYLDVNATGNCDLVMGDSKTTKLLGFALRDMTKTFLLKLDPTEFSFSYWCFLEEVTGVKDSLAYHMATYFAFPIEFAAYRCCRTGQSKYTTQSMYVNCLSRQVPHMAQVTIIPYVISLIVFAFFPAILLSYNTSKNASRTYKRMHVQQGAEQDEEEDDDQNDWVYLDGKPPLTFSALIVGLFGLEKSHPVAVSRFRRLLFVLFGPAVLFLELWVYSTYQHEMTMELLQHGTPMGYLSMLGGFEKSRANFMPLLGGPYMLLLFYYIAGVLFLVIPSDLGEIMHIGSRRASQRGHLSPLLMNEKAMEDLSGIKIIRTSGYSKAAAVCRGGFFMLVNPKFWSTAVKIQVNRVAFVCDASLCCGRSRCLKVFTWILCAPLLVLVSVVELALCVLYYGVPIVSVIIMASKGYLKSSLLIIINDGGTGALQRSAVWTRVWKYRAIRYFLAILISCIFIYFVFSVCTIFTVSFSFVSKFLAFSLVSVIVYPMYAFGYLFFGVAIVYYIFKLLKSFGEGYSELLADAVETSLHMEESLMYSQVVNGTVFLPVSHGAAISQIQIHDSVINLSTEQRQRIKDALPSRLQKIKENHHTTGIPKDLFDALVKQFRPVHIQVTQSLLWLAVVLGLIQITLSIIQVQPMTPREEINEMMHVIFITIVGALPEVLAVLIDSSDHSVKKNIQLKEIKAAICEYWSRREAQYYRAQPQNG